jgi:hypothetical protein
MNLSRHTKGLLMASILPAFAGGCMAAMSKGWQSTLADVPIGKSAGLLGFLMVLAGPLSWYLPGAMHQPLLATLVGIGLIAMMSANSLVDTPMARRLTSGGFILWWICGLITVAASAFRRAA